MTQTVPAILQGGEVADGKTEGVYMASGEEASNGIIISGDGEYTVKGVKADFEGYWRQRLPRRGLCRHRGGRCQGHRRRTATSPCPASPAAPSMWAGTATCR